MSTCAIRDLAAAAVIVVRGQRGLPAATATVALLLVVSAATAQMPDRLWLEPMRPTSAETDWYPRAIRPMTGKVLDLDAKQLRLIASGEVGETIYAAHRVLWIEPGEVSQLEADAMADFADQQYAESLATLPEVLQARPPVWRQQWLTMLAANAAWRSSRGKIALELVSQLDRRPLPPLTLAWLPVAWRSGLPSADASTAAQQRLLDPSAAVQLVAASWLLSSPQRSEAITVLKNLQASTERPEIASLAECVLWRTAAPQQVIESAAAWQQKLEALPLVWQVGPAVTLAEKLRSAGQTAAANRLQWSLELTPIHPHPELFHEAGR